MYPARTIEGPRGPFLVPAEPAGRSRDSEACVRNVFAGEYDYAQREARITECHSLCDVGSNVGAFTVWATIWWPAITHVYAYDPNGSALELYRENTRNLGLKIEVLEVAVTTSEAPLFMEHEDWGGSRTKNETRGRAVAPYHPSLLAAADILKVDAEGVEVEVFENYQHWSGVQVCIFEYHEEGDRVPCERMCARAGLVQTRHHGSPPKQGIQIWVRR